MTAMRSRPVSYVECSARERLAHIVDAGSFREWLPPSERLTSPHLALLGVPTAFDDGVAIGRATLPAGDRACPAGRSPSLAGRRESRRRRGDAVDSLGREGRGARR